jgi:mRNA-degrading endonuclease RelE of RelBE toxin-antitoxin system
MEFLEAAEWYEIKNEGLGERFRDLVNTKIESIKEHPERYPKKKSNYRKIALRNFPFIIIYIIKREELLLLTQSFIQVGTHKKT